MPPTKDTTWDEDDDGLDYELEPPDEDVVRMEKDRAQAEMAQAQHAIDVDAVYRKLDGRDEADFSWDPAEFRFGIRELLIATGVVALLLGMWRIGFLSPNLFAAFIAVALVGLGAAHTYVAWRERKRHEALIERQAYELRRARGEHGPENLLPEEPEPSVPGWEELKQTVRENLRFGIREMLTVTAFVALLMVPVRIVGAAGTAALVGLLVLVGLALQAADYELPRWIHRLWWLLILAYCVLMLGDTVAQALGLS